jgi:hypothetical protein
MIFDFSLFLILFLSSCFSDFLYDDQLIVIESAYRNLYESSAFRAQNSV